MHEHHPGTTRRAVLRSVPTPVDMTPDTEVWVYDAPPLLDVIDALPEPRIADLDALLRDVDQLRASLRRDLTLAATAAEAGETELARWLVSQDQSLRAFESSALGRLDHLADQEQVDQQAAAGTQRSRRMLTAAPFAAAAAFIFAFVGGVVPTSAPEPTTNPRTTNVALASYEAFTQLALQGGSASDITAAAERFHDDLGPLVDSPLTDPAAVNHAILLLQSERAVLLAGGDSSRELTQVLREADRLVARLRAGLSRRPLPVVVAEPIIPQPERREPERKPSSPKPSTAAKPSPSASPRPSPKPSPTATPSPKASEPSPDATQGPGTSPTDGPLPKSPPIG
ncbi:MAG: hypothetical protein ABIO67_00385 [Mycobacteriales bacterium]